jgi:hypothetical protein
MAYSNTGLRAKKDRSLPAVSSLAIKPVSSGARSRDIAIFGPSDEEAALFALLRAGAAGVLRVVGVEGDLLPVFGGGGA